MNLTEFVLRFFVGSALLTGLWCGVVIVLVRVMRIESPNARLALFWAPVIAAFGSRLRLLPDDHHLVLLVCGTVGLALLAIDFIGYRLYIRAVRSESCRDPRLRAALDHIAARLGMTGVDVARYTGRRVRGPLVVGMRQPVIIVPDRVANSMDDGELRALLAHELAHIRRGDLWTKWLLLICRRLAFWNPFLHVASRWIELEMERGSDQLASVKLRCRGALARALCKVSELGGGAHGTAVDRFPVVHAGTQLGVRVESLVRAERVDSKQLTIIKTTLAFVVLYQICLRPAELLNTVL